MAYFPSRTVELAGSYVTQLGALQVAEKTPIIEVSSALGLSTLRDITTVTGDAIIAAVQGEIVLTSSATASSSANIKSALIGRYIPGYAAEIGVGVRRTTAPTGNQTLLWGGLSVDLNNGLVWGEDATGVYVARITNGVEAGKTYQSSWNLDVMDGTGSSGLTLDMTAGNIFQIDFTWYGYGQILWGIVGIVDNVQSLIPVHQEKVNGSTSIESPNMRVFAECDNGGDASNVVLYLGGRQYSIIGKYVPSYRFTGEYRGSVATSTTLKPLITFRAKAGFENRPISLDSITALIATANVMIEIVIGGALTGASYATPTNYTASETALEVDISATAITGGTVVWNELESAGTTPNKATLTSEALVLNLNSQTSITLCARTLSGTGTIESFFRLKEEW